SNLLFESALRQRIMLVALRPQSLSPALYLASVIRCRPYIPRPSDDVTTRSIRPFRTEQDRAVEKSLPLCATPAAYHSSVTSGSRWRVRPSPPDRELF